MLYLILLLILLIIYILLIRKKKSLECFKNNLVKVNFNELDDKQFKKHISSSYPVIFKNTFNNKISFKNFCKILSDKEIKIRTGNYGTVEGREDREFYKMALKEYCEDSSNDYGGNNIITKDEIDKLDLKINNKNIKEFNTGGKLWIGKKDSRTPLHKDKPENLALQIYGKKKWIVYDSKDKNKLCYKKSNNVLEWSKFSIFDYDTCPSAKKLTPIEIILEQGDLLYLPKQWSHDVTNITDSIMINFWYENSNNIPFK